MVRAAAVASILPYPAGHRQSSSPAHGMNDIPESSNALPTTANGAAAGGPHVQEWLESFHSQQAADNSRSAARVSLVEPLL